MSTMPKADPQVALDEAKALLAAFPDERFHFTPYAKGALSVSEPYALLSVMAYGVNQCLHWHGLDPSGCVPIHAVVQDHNWAVDRAREEAEQQRVLENYRGPTREILRLMYAETNRMVHFGIAPQYADLANEIAEHLDEVIAAKSEVSD